MRSLPKRFTDPGTATGGAQTATPPPAGTAPALPPATAGGQHWPGRELLDSAMLARVLLAAWGGDACTVVPACPGAGKSRLVALLAGALAHGLGCGSPWPRRPASKPPSWRGASPPSVTGLR
jgi:hypothetical protein